MERRGTRCHPLKYEKPAPRNEETASRTSQRYCKPCWPGCKWYQFNYNLIIEPFSNFSHLFRLPMPKMCWVKLLQMHRMTLDKGQSTLTMHQDKEQWMHKMLLDKILQVRQHAKQMQLESIIKFDSQPQFNDPNSCYHRYFKLYNKATQRPQ